MYASNPPSLVCCLVRIGVLCCSILFLKIIERTTEIPWTPNDLASQACGHLLGCLEKAKLATRDEIFTMPSRMPH